MNPDQQVMAQVLARRRPERMPRSCWRMVEYRPEVYHLGDMEVLPAPGEVAVSADGKRRFTHDGGVWAVGDRQRYRTHEDVLATPPEQFPVEPVGPPMLEAMACVASDAARTSFAWPLHYGTLVTRATIEFGWEPFLTAAALQPRAFARLLDRFGAASLAVIEGWCRTPGVSLIAVHDDIAATRGPILSPTWLREYVFPWYERLFAAIHAAGRQVLYMSDGNYLPVLPELLATNPDGLYIETSAMDPGEFMAAAGHERLYLIKTNNQTMDLGRLDDLRDELRRLGDLHRRYPGMMIYAGGGNPAPTAVAAFERHYQDFLTGAAP